MALFEALAELVGAAIVSAAPQFRAVTSSDAGGLFREFPAWLRDNGGASSLEAVIDAMTRDIWLSLETRGLSQQLLEFHAAGVGQLLLKYPPQSAEIALALDRARSGTASDGGTRNAHAQKISVDIYSRAANDDAVQKAGLKADVTLFMIERAYGHLLDDPALVLGLALPLLKFSGLSAEALEGKPTNPGLLALQLSAASTRALEQTGGMDFLSDLRERYALSEKAIERMLKLVDKRSTSTDQYVREIERLAAWAGDVKAQLSKPSNEESEVRRLKGKAAAAMADGDFEAAADALREIRREVRVSRRRTEERLADEVAGLRAQMTEEARATARLGELRLAEHDFAAAAEFFGEATLALPTAERELTWRFDLQRAEALLGHGEHQADQKAIADAINAFALSVRTATEVSDRKGLAQANLGLGRALALAGERESASTARLKDAIAPLRKAANILARESDSDGRVAVQLQLGRVLGLIGERDKSASALRDAADAYRDVLKDIEADRHSATFVTVQIGLGNALLSLEEREGGTDLLVASAAAYSAALDHLNRDEDPARWANAQMNLGVASLGLGEHVGGEAQLAIAVDAFQRAMEVSTRASTPKTWALLQLNIGNAYAALGEKDKSSVSHIEACITAYSSALEEFQREVEPLKWAIAQMNLGAALIRLGEHREKRRHWLAAAGAMVPALEVFEAHGASDYAEITRQSLRRFHESWDQLLAPAPVADDAKSTKARLSKAG